MACEVRLPQHGMGMQEGTVLNWFRHEGEAVAEGDVLLEVEAAKTTFEITAPASGVMARILAPAGTTVPVREVLGIIAAPGEALTAPEPGADRTTPHTPSAARAAATITVQVEPRARRLAQQRGVDLAAVRGSGPGGRITEADVQRAADTAGSGLPPPAPASPLSGMRAAIATRMHASLANGAQLTLTTGADASALVALHGRLRDDDRPSYTDFMIKAAALALRRHPRMNATLDADGLRLRQDVAVGFAVALDEGLIVPVIRDADGKDLRAIGAERRALTARAREGRLDPAEVSGGSFTITNLGGFGIDAFTPILNAPEIGILGIGRIREVPVRQGDAIAWTQSMALSLTFDHRAIDGAPAAAFLQTLCAILHEAGSQLTH
ncbi:MAG: dihydrolipoamide acetyltransferase family protein [Gammaproteobacteria bacterium]